MHLFLWAEDSDEDLRCEILRALPGAAPQFVGPALLRAELPPLSPSPLPHLAFARQWLPGASPVHALSIRALAAAVAERIVGTLPDDQPWTLHVEPRYGARPTHRIGARAWHSAMRRGGGRGIQTASQAAVSPLEERLGAGSPQPAADAGRQRANLVREAVVEVLRRRRRHLLRRLRREPAAFTPADSLVQFLLTAPDAAFLSVAPAPLPFEQRHLLSPFPLGDVPVASDKTAPSRAFAKLLEAELRLGRGIAAGETCVDLGAAPGSWTYVASRRGARVTAVDRSPLREDLLADPRVEFQPGDAFRFAPGRPVDWLLCDVIAAPDRTAALLLEWLRRRWCRHFIVTLKTGDVAGTEVLDGLKRELPPLTAGLFLTRLCANKKELCVFGDAA